jgi:hypothetical protein
MEYLKQMDEISLMERLSITSEDIVERFADNIEEQADDLEAEIEEESEEE